MLKRSTEIKKLDAALSKYIRSSNADDAGLVECFTCGKRNSWKYETDAGHFQTRSKYSTRWLYDPDNGLVNIMPQCKHCNLTNGGQQYIFGKRLDSIFGEGSAEKVVDIGNTLRKYTTGEIVELRKKYEELLKE